MAVGTISISEGDGDKVLATASVLQNGTQVELQRVVLENWGNAGADTYMISVEPTSNTADGIIFAVENIGGLGKNVYVSRIEVEQRTVAGTAVVRTVAVGRAPDVGTGGNTISPSSVDPGGAAASALIRTSSAATPDTGIDELDSLAGEATFAKKPLYLGSTIATLGKAVFDFAGPGGQYPSVPDGLTEPIAMEISGSADGADLIINVVLIEHEV
jgi:hypothetical protein